MKNFITDKIDKFKNNHKGTNGRERIFSGSDGVRAIACLMVILHHISQRLIPDYQVPVLRELIYFFRVFDSGVSIFFVLSGFLLSYPFWRDYLSEKNYPDIKVYTVKRAYRIMPGYYAAFLFSIIMTVIYEPGLDHFWQRFIAGMTFTSGFHYITLFPTLFDTPLWSISFEVFSYILMPLFMIGIFFLIGKKRSLLKALLFWIGVELFIIFVNALIHKFLTPDSLNRGWQFGLTGASKFMMPNYNPVGFFGHFALGIMASGLNVTLSMYSSTKEKFTQKGIFDILSMLFLAGIFLILWQARHIPQFSFSIQNQPYYFPFFTILTACLLVTLSHSIYLGKLLDNSFLKYTAKISFGLYIWHYIVINFIQIYWVKNYLTGLYDWKIWLFASLILILISYLIAGLSYKFIEKPFLNHANTRSIKKIQEQEPLNENNNPL